MPKVSVIIRTLNEEKHLGNLLNALKLQDLRSHEVIVVDSGSTDRTLEIAKEFKVRIISIESRDFTFGYALNIGCKAGSGEYFVFASAHVLPLDDKWLSNLVRPFEDNTVAMVYGRQVGHESSKFSERIDFERLFGTDPTNSRVPLHYANNANSAVRKALWKIQPFDEYLFGLEDIDWARRIAKEGYQIRYEPSAPVYHMHNERWYQVLNRYRREAIAAVRIGLAEPPQAKTTITWLIFFLLHDLVRSFPNYRRSRLEEILRFRYYQWKGSRLGMEQGKHLDFETARASIFYPLENTAVIIRGPHKAELSPLTLPDMRPGDILIKVEYVGVCRTDLEVYEGTLGYYRDGVASYPIVPGHEFSGTIAKIGSNNRFQERFKVGDRVVGECILSRGHHSEREEVGVVNRNGAYSSYVMLPGDHIHKIPSGLDARIAVLTEPLAVVLRALRRIESRFVSRDLRIAIMGAGQIGNLATQVLAHRGYSVDVFDRDDARLRLVRTIARRTATELEDLGLYDIVIEATGSAQVLEKVLAMTKVDATVLLLGFPYGETRYNFEDIVSKEKIVVGSVGADTLDFEAALPLLPDLDMEAYLRMILPLEDYADAWKRHRTGKYLKIMLKP